MRWGPHRVGPFSEKKKEREINPRCSTLAQETKALRVWSLEAKRQRKLLLRI